MDSKTKVQEKEKVIIKNKEFEEATARINTDPLNIKRKPGRPRKEGVPGQEDPLEIKPVPPANESEAQSWAALFSGLINIFIKKDYKEKLSFDQDELLAFTRPLTQLKAYYFPQFSGIAITWTETGSAALAIGFKKYQVIQGIIKKDKKTDVRKENNPDNGDKGNGKDNEGEGDHKPTEAPVNL